MTPPKLILRPAAPEDLNLIRHDWFLSYRHSTDVRPDVYDRGQNALMERLIERCPPIVASLEAVPEEIVGWVCRDVVSPVVHYVYVKHAFRRVGIASALIAGAKNHTHETKAGTRPFARVGSLFNPYFLTTGVLTCP